MVTTLPGSRPEARFAGEPLAAVWRSGVLEGVHSGHVRVADASGRVVLQRGGDVEFFPRSAWKPFQALAALRAGANLTGPQLALACASHAGSPAHVEVVDSILASAGLDRRALGNTPDFPLEAVRVHRAGGGKAPVTQNCSGKHAAMLAACRAAGWDTGTYLDPGHPLQQRIAETIGTLTGTEPRWGIDGCGAPAATTTLSGLARAAGALVRAEPGTDEHRIASAMRTHPELVSGSGRFDTRAMQTVPGLVLKGGAEGVLMGGLTGGGTIITKISDGNHRASAPAFAAALTALGVEADLTWAREAVLGGGHGVGHVEWISG